MISMCIVPQLVTLVEGNALIISITVQVDWSHIRLDQLMQALQQPVQPLHCTFLGVCPIADINSFCSVQPLLVALRNT